MDAAKKHIRNLHAKFPLPNQIEEGKGDICEEHTQKIRWTDKKTTFFEAVREVHCGWKIDTKKAHANPVLNLHTKFQPLNSNWRRVMRRIKSKCNNTRPKMYVFGAVGRYMVLKSRTLPPPPKTHLWSLSSLHTKFQLPSSIRNGNRKGTVPFQG